MTEKNIPRSFARDSLGLDLLCCWLISIGILLALRQLFRFEHPFPVLTMRSGAVLLLLAIVTRRWWHAVAFFSAAAIFLLGFLWVSGQWTDFSHYARELIVWWVDLFPASSPYNTQENIAVVLWLIVVGVSVPVFAAVRRTHRFWVVVAFSALLLYIIVSNKFYENAAALGFIGAGGLPLLVQGHHRSLLRRADTLLVSRRRMMALGAVFCTASAVMAVGIVPNDTSHWKSPPLSNLFERIKDSRDPLSRQPFTLHMSGLQPHPSRLGGNLDLEHRLVLRVKTAYPVPMKGRVYTLYNGSGWDSGEHLTYPLEENSSALQRATFGLDLPDSIDGENPLEDAMPVISAQVDSIFGGHTVYHSGNLLSVQAPDKVLPLLFSSHAELFPSHRIPVHSSYRFVSRRFSRLASDLPARIRAIEQSAASPPQTGRWEEYLRLPDSLPDSIAKTALDAAGNSPSVYARMLALESFLQDNYEYTLQPGDVPADRDFVEYFLETKQGYCVYHATAMAVMARTLDVPSRFVIGYGLVEEGNGYSAYTDNAHAWVECYIHGVGWISFDPTPGSEYSPPIPPASISQLDDANEPDGTNESEEPTTQPTDSLPVTTHTTEPSQQPEPSSAPSADNQSTPYWVRIAGSILIVLLLAALMALRIWQRSQAYLLENVRMRFADNADRADYYYTDLLRQLRLLGLPAHVGETMRQHGRRASHGIQGADLGILSAFETVMNWRYGSVPPTDWQIEQLAEVHQKLERHLRLTLSPLGYFLRRRLL